jgi:hypothetical protein
MNAAQNLALVSRIVSSIPERTPRFRSGTAFSLDGGRACSDPARLVSVARLLQWLSPLNPLSGDDQRTLGLLASGLRPGHLGDEGGAEADDAEDTRDAAPPAAERLPF